MGDYFSVTTQDFLKAITYLIIWIEAKNFLIMSSGCKRIYTSTLQKSIYWNSKLLSIYAMRLCIQQERSLTITKAKTRDEVILIKSWQCSSYYWNCLFIWVHRIPEVMQALPMERSCTSPLIAFGKINAYNKVGRFQPSLCKSSCHLHKICN